jgi:hypothetical protein
MLTGCRRRRGAHLASLWPRSLVLLTQIVGRTEHEQETEGNVLVLSIDTVCVKSED